MTAEAFVSKRSRAIALGGGFCVGGEMKTVSRGGGLCRFNRGNYDYGQRRNVRRRVSVKRMQSHKAIYPPSNSLTFYFFQRHEVQQVDRRARFV